MSQDKPTMWDKFIVGFPLFFMGAIVLALVASALSPQRPRTPPGYHIIGNTKQTAFACIMYSTDYDEHLPTAPYWMVTVQPYIKNYDIFRTDIASDRKPLSFQTLEADPKAWVPGRFGIVMNVHVAGANRLHLEESFRVPSGHPGEFYATTPLTFESPGREWHAIGDPRENPASLRKGESGKPIKCVAFVDGRARALKQEEFEKLVPNPLDLPPPSPTQNQ